MKRSKWIKIPANALLVVLAGGGLFSAVAHADEMAERQRLLAEIDKVIHDEAKREAAVSAGRERSRLCASCHGKSGNSLSPDIPNLAKQNPAYLLEQIKKFADGRRRDRFMVMRPLAKSFTLEDKVNLAVFYSQSELEPKQTDSVLAAQGHELFVSRCVSCHGVDGKGEAGYARLAGQQSLYVENTLKRFRENALTQPTADERVRSSARMEQVTQNLTDDQIRALAAYVGSLR